jgi:RNA polymerase sigma factor (sigma-70 family)
MRLGRNASVLRELDRLFGRGVAPSGDAALLERFLAEGDDSAFEALVVRHGPMVLGVCRRILISRDDADDAFQASFLVLARKAAGLRGPDRLGPWLYGVATRVARKVRKRAARHRHEALTEYPARGRPEAGWSDVMPIIDTELGRLPSRHRDVLILCLLEGASAEEAAQRLGCPVGTVKSRLARGRQSLRDRLMERGITPDIALAVLSASEWQTIPLSPPLIRATLGAIASSATTAGVSALTRGATLSMFSKSTVTVSLIAGGIAVAGIAAATWMTPSWAQGPGDGSRINAGPSQDHSFVQINNLKQIALAIHKYLSANTQFPAMATYGPDSLPTLSWRVALLPYLEQNELYRQFRQDEPWDSPHNKALAARMPAVFETPVSPAPQGQTRIRGYAGKGTMFDGSQPIRIWDVTDGTSNTLLVAVADEATPWTKPGELPFVPGRRLPALDSRDPNGYQIALADGAVRSLAFQDAKLLPDIITRNGGEAVQWPPMRPPANATSVEATPTLLPTAPVVPFPPPAGAGAAMAGAGGMTTMLPPAAPGGAMMAGVGGTTPIQALDQRMQKMEEKLELILRRLDAAGLERPR